MTGHYLYIMININANFQVYKKVALSNRSNFRHKFVTTFIYLYYLMTKSVKRKLEYDYFKRANIFMYFGRTKLQGYFCE